MVPSESLARLLRTLRTPRIDRMIVRLYRCELFREFSRRLRGEDKETAAHDCREGL